MAINPHWERVGTCAGDISIISNWVTNPSASVLTNPAIGSFTSPLNIVNIGGWVGYV